MLGKGGGGTQCYEHRCARTFTRISERYHETSPCIYTHGVIFEGDKAYIIVGMVTFVAARAELHVSDFSKLLKKLNHMTSVMRQYVPVRQQLMQGCSSAVSRHDGCVEYALIGGTGRGEGLASSLIDGIDQMKDGQPVLEIHVLIFIRPLISRCSGCCHFKATGSPGDGGRHFGLCRRDCCFCGSLLTHGNGDGGGGGTASAPLLPSSTLRWYVSSSAALDSFTTTARCFVHPGCGPSGHDNLYHVRGVAQGSPMYDGVLATVMRACSECGYGFGVTRS